MRDGVGGCWCVVFVGRGWESRGLGKVELLGYVRIDLKRGKVRGDVELAV